MAKINKSLDLNKLFIEQKKGKLLSKNLKFPMFAGIKYDGNYTVVIKEAQGMVTYISSGGHIYDNNKSTIFDLPVVPIGVYIAERIATDGQLGDRKRCSLRGPRGNQTAYNHKYMIHDMLTLEEYEASKSNRPYIDRRDECRDTFGDYWVSDMLLYSQEEVEKYLAKVVKNGYEGIMLKSPDWLWRDTSSRTIVCAKYKTRPTADLLCIGYKMGTGKYEGMIGSLKMKDSQGRICDVGSGMDDADRLFDPKHFIGKVLEVEYEQIMDTYIQPTFGSDEPGITIRYDKSENDID